MSDVYFVATSENDPMSTIQEKIKSLYDKAGFGSFVQKNDIVSIKTHFGEKGNVTHLVPEQIRPIVDKVKESEGKPYLTETSVLYKSSRSNALDHINLAFEHGFTFEKVGAPIIMADGFLGNWEREILINGEFYEKVSIAGDAIAADKLIVVSHVTGHLVAGFGAALKNLGMGLSSRKGKLNQHSDVAPIVDAELCDFCKTCIKWCPENCIEVKAEKAFINEEKCIGCGECIAVCKQDAVKFKWDASSEMLQKKMVEHAFGIFTEMKDRIIYINFLTNMTKDCDCMKSKEKLIDDIGILASYDPVALEKASLDFTAKKNEDNLSKMSFPNHNPLVQINHAIKLGMGTQDYKIVEVT